MPLAVSLAASMGVVAVCSAASVVAALVVAPPVVAAPVVAALVVGARFVTATIAAASSSPEPPRLPVAPVQVVAAPVVVPAPSPESPAAIVVTASVVAAASNGPAAATAVADGRPPVVGAGGDTVATSVIPARVVAAEGDGAAAFDVATGAPAADVGARAARVLVKLAVPPADDDVARAALAALDLVLERRSVHGWLLARGEGDPRLLADRVARAPGVVAAQPVGRVRALRAPTDPLWDDQWSLHAIDVERAWTHGRGGEALRVGVVDTGLRRDHVDLASRDRGGWDFVADPDFSSDGDGRDADYDDDTGDGHGTHVAGVIAARVDDGVGVAGIVPRVGLVTVRALAEEGGDVVDVVEGASWLAGLSIDDVPDRAPVDVINLSLGGDAPCSAYERDAYDAIVGAGVVVVAASGNDGNDVATRAPADCPGVIAVAATDSDLALASYANFDDRVDVVAPGGDARAGILSADGATTRGWIAMSGTSMAAPHVAGVAALMRAADPTLAPDDVAAILRDSPYTCEGCDDVAFLDARDAVARAAAGVDPRGGGAAAYDDDRAAASCAAARARTAPAPLGAVAACGLLVSFRAATRAARTRGRGPRPPPGT